MSDSLLISSDKDTKIAALEALLAEARAELLHRDMLIETMRVQLARLRRMQFGASSEKLSAEIAQLELALEELEAAAPVAQASTVPPKSERPTPMRALPDHLPREDVIAQPPSGTCACPDCGGTLRKLGEDSAEQLDVAPVQWRVVRTIRPKYSCRVCESEHRAVPGAREDAQRSGIRPCKSHRTWQGDLRHTRTRHRCQVRPSPAALPPVRDDGGAG